MKRKDLLESLFACCIIATGCGGSTTSDSGAAGAGGSGNADAAGTAGDAAAEDGTESAPDGDAAESCARTDDPITFSLLLPDGPAMCAGEFPYYPPVIVEGSVVETQASLLRIDSCAAGTGCTPTLAELRVGASGLDLRQVPLGAFVHVSYHCFTSGGATRYYTEVTTIDSFGDASSPAGQAGVTLLAAALDDTPPSDGSYQMDALALGCCPPERCGAIVDDYLLTFTPRVAPDHAVPVRMGETLPFDFGTASAGGRWVVRNLHSYRSAEPPPSSYQVDDFAWFISWEKP